MIRSAGPPHTGLMCENEHFDGTWERIKPDLYRHNSLTFSDKGGKVFLSQTIGNLAHPDCIVKVTVSLFGRSATFSENLGLM